MSVSRRRTSSCRRRSARRSTSRAFTTTRTRQLIAQTASQPDPAKRKEGYSKINDYLLDQAYCLVISGYPNILAQAPNVRDLGYYPVLQWTLRHHLAELGEPALAAELS